MVHGRIIGQGEDISDVIKIRQEVFKDEGDENLQEYHLHEELDPMALNVILDEDGVFIGSGRLNLDLVEDRFYVDDICIKKGYRGNKYGDFLVRILAEKAVQCGADKIYAEVPGYAKAFFEKMFFKEEGFENGSGLMCAELKSFQSCCHAAQNDGSYQATEASVGACGKEGGCASCGGCGSSLKADVQPGEDRRYR